MNVSHLKSCLVASLAATGFLSAAAAHGAVLLSDNFNDLGSGVTLANTAHTQTVANSSGNFVDTFNPTTGKWVGNTSAIVGNGTGGVTYPNAANAPRSTSVDIGTTLNTTLGVYSLSLDIGYAATSTGTQWTGMGFTPSGFNSDSLDGNGGSPIILMRGNGEVDVYAGAGLTNELGSIQTTLGSMHTLTLVLDTTSTGWTLSASADGVTIDLDPTTTGTTYTFATNPTSDHLVDITSSGLAGTSGTIDNLLLTGPTASAVPEPSSLGILTGTVGMAFIRRRRRNA